MTFAIDALYAVAFILGAVGLSLGAYLLTRRLTNDDVRDQHKEMASAMVVRIGALHALIITLVFAQEMAAYQRLEGQTASEASSIADVYNDASRYDPVLLEPIRAQMRAYIRVVVDVEWPALGRGDGLSSEAWAAWSAAYSSVLDLEPASARQASLRDHMLASLHSISSARDMRASESSRSVANLFWFAAISGMLLIATGHYIYRPERQNVMLMGAVQRLYRRDLLSHLRAVQSVCGAGHALTSAAGGSRNRITASDRLKRAVISSPTGSCHRARSSS